MKNFHHCFTALALMIGVATTACTGLSQSTESTDLKQAGENGDPHVEARVLASYRSGAFLENLEVLPDGRILFTNYPEKTIYQFSPEGEVSRFANLSAFPLAMISTANGYLVTANGKNILIGEDATNSQQLLILDKNGEETGRIDAPQAKALNGLAQLDHGKFFAADSAAGTIWEIDTKTQAVTPWLQHESLAPLADDTVYKPGANGVKLRSDGLIVSNTSRGTLSLIKIGEDGSPAGEPEVIASVGMIDDFWINDDGSILFTTHEDSIKRLSKDGSISVVATQNLIGNTAVAPYPLNQSSSFAVTTDGGMYFGVKDPARVVLITTAPSSEK